MEKGGRYVHYLLMENKLKSRNIWEDRRLEYSTNMINWTGKGHLAGGSKLVRVACSYISQCWANLPILTDSNHLQIFKSSHINRFKPSHINRFQCWQTFRQGVLTFSTIGRKDPSRLSCRRPGPNPILENLKIYQINIHHFMKTQGQSHHKYRGVE